ncbi:hypothetical protein CK203_064742 [Vitis vinifera]|uniref:Uncharacterized protein n=1 Tax=Vitis vinifera TaxID=29760 RepID=A0A438G3Q4_VITVI|nr:hypothetical protein CK203_064742 [Vitis vinifera]
MFLLLLEKELELVPNTLLQIFYLTINCLKIIGPLLLKSFICLIPRTYHRKGGERERERAGERESESESDGGERVNLCASKGAESNVRLEPRNSLRKSSFDVESKTFKIEVEKKKGKVQVIIVERKRGVSSWVKLGPKSLGLFVESPVL